MASLLILIVVFQYGSTLPQKVFITLIFKSSKWTFISLTLGFNTGHFRIGCRIDKTNSSSKHKLESCVSALSTVLESSFHKSTRRIFWIGKRLGGSGGGGASAASSFFSAFTETAKVAAASSFSSAFHRNCCTALRQTTPCASSQLESSP